MGETSLGGHRWIALNVKEALNTASPGEYHYDTKTSVITYARRHTPNESSQSQQAAALVGVWPRLPTLVSIVEGASNITFRGIQLSHTALGPDPANISYGPAAYAAIEIAGGIGIEIDSVIFAHTGGNGLQTMPSGGGVRNLTVGGSVFRDIGGRGFTCDEHWEGTASVSLSQVRTHVRRTYMSAQDLYMSVFR
jgi:hypothetical protein